MAATNLTDTFGSAVATIPSVNGSPIPKARRWLAPSSDSTS
jgi:hypothetical protein